MENTQNLIGRKFIGFKFKSTADYSYLKSMDEFINNELIITNNYGYCVEATNINGCTYIYPLKEVLNHLIPEEPQIPELPEGVLMLVSHSGDLPNDKWKKRFVIGKDKYGSIFTYTEDMKKIIQWSYCKSIPKLPNYTLQELKEKIGHDFNLID